MKILSQVESRENNCWKSKVPELSGQASEDKLIIHDASKQEILGFGGCFNELGWDALSKISEEDRENFMKELFSKEGCRFNVGRIPIGANDFSLEWYSCDETPDDYELKDFNINRDRIYTIPYIHNALKYAEDGVSFFASPWSPPTWMKTKRVYNFGRIRMEEKVLKAYADYFVKFVTEYRKEGIEVDMVHVQNEPMADQKFPSCLWHGTDMRDFIKGYLGPAFEKSGLSTEIWLGTINGPFTDFRWPGVGAPYEEFYDQFSNTVLSDPEARKYIAGVGVQWGGKHQLEQIACSYPEMKIMQTESECGDGKNEWEQAEYIFTQMWYYFRHGAQSYTYWNMALLEGGISSWGWTQNSLAVINEEKKTLTLQPEFYLMKHLSHFVEPGARLKEVSGHWTANAMVFENPDGKVIIAVMNSMDHDREMTIEYAGESFTTMIKSHSINTFEIKA